MAYGMPGIQVDGNDILAVYAAAREAVDRARSGGGLKDASNADDKIPSEWQECRHRYGAHGACRGALASQLSSYCTLKPYAPCAMLFALCLLSSVLCPQNAVSPFLASCCSCCSFSFLSVSIKFSRLSM